MSPAFAIRPAVAADIPVLRELIDASVRQLQSSDYTPAQIDSALRTVFGVDSQLIDDGTYLLVQAGPLDSGKSPVIVACGGWSKRKTLYGGDRWRDRRDDLLDPANEAAKIRAFFIHPDWARQGIGTLLLDACETAARAAGFRRFEMGATLTGAKLFQKRGYVAGERLEVLLEGDVTLTVIHMVKGS
ncbi:MAG TPA: GNAT family N-acetyltransferase [Candidatus Angelobacter sp.]|jgi:GNAT superfamily N-acetyltransferase|nr:GNAT family N-acetyltransferase [Candidatus Angelobacter sp.]